MIFILIGSILLGLIILTLLFCLYIYFQTFYNDRKGKPEAMEPFSGGIYAPFEDQSRALIKTAVGIPFEQVTLRVNKHKKLCARYYFVKENAPTAIMVHGYKGVGIRDFSGGIQELLKMETNVLIIDHYGHGLSDGKTITFGVKEKYDVLRWIDYINERNHNPEIYLYGISMGAATVLMTGGLDLPKNIKGIIADCPYSSVKDELEVALVKKKLPVKLVYPYMFLSALIFARFNIKKGEVSDYLKNCKIPILLIHGDIDDVVPVESSRKLKEKFPDLIEYVEVAGAPHGMSYFAGYDKYIDAINKFVQR